MIVWWLVIDKIYILLEEYLLQYRRYSLYIENKQNEKKKTVYRKTE